MSNNNNNNKFKRNIEVIIPNENNEIKSVWIGDPCYSLVDKNIETELDIWHYFCGFLCAPTEYGNGSYPSTSRFAYSVDSALLALIPDYMMYNTSKHNISHGKFFDVNGSIKMIRTVEGVFVFEDNNGPFEKIYTNCNGLFDKDELGWYNNK